jgi:tetraacyldisaccharide 4'-kinase
MDLADRLTRAWYAPRAGALARLLAPLAWLYAAVVAVRRALYRRGILVPQRVGVPVVVIGNVTVGGTGKTPLALALAEALAARGWHPGFVSRGYGRGGDEVRVVRPGDDANAVGDEPLLLAATGHPVAVGRDRAAAARALVAAHPPVDVVIADDGLQHYALARDVEIAVVDASRGFGNGRMLPAGPLREPLARLDEVDAIVRLVDAACAEAVAGRGDGRETVMTHEPVAWRNLADPGRRADPATFRPARAWAIAGTGHPERFFALVRALGVEARTRAFPDHHDYVRSDLDLDQAESILMTAKDAVKCAAFADARLWALDIRARIDGALVDRVETKLDGSEAPGDPRLPGDQGPARLRS